MHHRHEIITTLKTLGITWEDADALRRISMTLHRWHELECGDASGWTIEREGENGDGKPHMVHHLGGRHRYAVPDREAGALKRLKVIMAQYPELSYYVQGDPRGAALYILRPGDVPEGQSADAYYSRGIAVYK